MASISELSSFEAEGIIESFRQGTVPARHLDLYSIGRERWLTSVSKDLSFIAQGGSKIRFLSAPYGGGKTHFFMQVKTNAIASNHILSYVELNSREAPFDRFEVIFPKIMRGVILQNGQGIEFMLENWARRFPYYNSQEVESNLRQISPSLDFRAALRACLEYVNTNSAEHRMRMQGIVAWLQGYQVMAELKSKGIRSNITIANVSEILGSFLRFVRSSGYSGLVILLDEAEAITSLTQSHKRQEANQNVRKLLDNADEHSGLYVLFATTPKFISDPINGAQSYPALWSRIKDVIGGGLQQTSSRSTIIVFPPLDQFALKELAQRIINTHAQAYQWDASNQFNINAVEKYINVFLQNCDPLMIRLFIKGLVNVLDVIEENPSMELNSLLDNLQFENKEDKSS